MTVPVLVDTRARTDIEVIGSSVVVAVFAVVGNAVLVLVRAGALTDIEIVGGSVVIAVRVTPIRNAILIFVRAGATRQIAWIRDTIAVTVRAIASSDVEVIGSPVTVAVRVTLVWNVVLVFVREKSVKTVAVATPFRSLSSRSTTRLLLWTPTIRLQAKISHSS